jgi:hypothetical protein
MNGRYLGRGFVALLGMALVAATPHPSICQAGGILISGTVLEGSTGQQEGASYGFLAGSAGVLSVVVRSLDETDLVLLVTDADGQPLPEGRSDQDLGGDPGAEQFAVTLPRAGEYQVRVETFGVGQASFKIGVSWLPFPDLAVPADPDGSPGTAIRIWIGQDTRNDLLDGAAGDSWDWFVLKAEKAGTLTLATRAEEGDLILEAFTPGKFTEALERSDQDLQGKGGNEALTLAVEAGDEFFFKVSAFGEVGSFSYRLQIGFIPSSDGTLAGASDHRKGGAAVGY